MPTEYGSASLVPLPISAIGSQGLNLQAQTQLLPPQWCTTATNLVFDAEGRLSSRDGWAPVNGTPISGTPKIGQIFEYTPITGSNQVITAAGNKLYTGTTTLTDISGTVTITADNWKFVNFNGLCYGLQAGHDLIVYTGTGDFTTVTAATGTVPNGNELLSAFGRLWGSDSTGQLLKYSQLLDATNWTVTGAGEFDLTSVWANGNDNIVALASFNNYLIVFGTKNVIVWADGTGSPLGMDPINMSVNDIVPGIGCTARDTVQNCNGDDLVFLTYAGLQSLKRIIIERSNAIKNLSLNVRDSLNLSVRADTLSNLRSTYNAGSGFYLLLLPASGVLYCFDTKTVLQDGTWRVTIWNSFVPTALYTLHDSFTTYSGFEGQLFQYTGSQDNGSAYSCTYKSPWLALDEDVETRIKMLKRISSIVAFTGSGVLSVLWAFDFSDSFTSTQVPLVGTGSDALWGVAQWGTDSWGGGESLAQLIVPASGAGQYIKIGLVFVANSSSVAFIQSQLYSKIGRVI